MSQTNTRVGDIPTTAGEDLTGKEDRLVKLANDSGATVAKLPEANSDLALFVLIEGAEADKTAALRPLNADRNVRLPLKGTCNPGDMGRGAPMRRAISTYAVFRWWRFSCSSTFSARKTLSSDW